MRNHKIGRLIACTTAIAALFAVQATTASAVVTMVSPWSTNTSFGPSSFSFSAGSSTSPYSHIPCNITGGHYQILSGAGVNAPAWFTYMASPAIACPGTVASWQIGGINLGVQAALSGNDNGVVEINANGMYVNLGCGTLRVNQKTTITPRWIDGNATTDAKVRFDQDTNIPAYYAGGCAGIGISGTTQNIVIDAGSEWKIRNNSPSGGGFVATAY